MLLASQVMTVVVAVLHGWFLVLEMFLWATPFGAKTLAQPLEVMQQSKPLAANQGLYNGFLAAGLVWSLAVPVPSAQLFFLTCVVLAGVFGGLTASPKILFVQALPGAIALVLVLVSR